MEIFVVTVFENGDGTTSPWAVYKNENEAEKYKKELLAGELNQDGYYLDINITKHKEVEEVEEIFVVTVFENGDGTTSPWGIYTNEAEAEEYKKELLAGELNQNGYYLDINVTKHKVLEKHEE